MFITYNEYPSTENLYTLFYWNRAEQLEITRKYINYLQGYNTAYCDAISMIIRYNEYPSSEYIFTEFYWNRANQLRITRKCINYVQG
jgi:hypothetical protein